MLGLPRTRFFVPSYKFVTRVYTVYELTKNRVRRKANTRSSQLKGCIHTPALPDFTWRSWTSHRHVPVSSSQHLRVRIRKLQLPSWGWVWWAEPQGGIVSCFAGAPHRKQQQSRYHKQDERGGTNVTTHTHTRDAPHQTKSVFPVSSRYSFSRSS